MKTRVITDSGSGLSEKQAQDLDIDFLPLQVTVDGENYLDGVDLNIETLYKMLDEGKMPATSQPPLALEEELFEKYEQDGVSDAVLITLSSGLSSTNQAIQAAAKRHGINIHTLDIFTTLGIQKYCAEAAKILLDQGRSPQEVIEILKNAIDDSAGYLMVDNLEHLAAGGRLTPMAAKLGGLLKIKPILQVSKDTEGKVDIYDKVRTFNKAVKKAVDKVASQLTPGKEYEFYVLNGENDEGTEYAVAQLKEAFGDDITIHMDPMYSVIAAHTGLGSVGIQYIPKLEGVVVE